jgi:hypothetical protein
VHAGYQRLALVPPGVGPDAALVATVELGDANLQRRAAGFAKGNARAADGHTAELALAVHRMPSGVAVLPTPAGTAVKGVPPASDR